MTTKLFWVTQFIADNIEVDGVYIDFSKAFDWLDRGI